MDNELEQILAGLTPEQEDALYKRSLAVLASRYSVEGFRAFFELVMGEKMPEYAAEWVDGVFEVEKKNKRLAVEAFRGSGKSTTMTVAFTAFYLGHHPTTSNFLIQAGDDMAVANTKNIAGIIESNPGWKLVFPYLLPDEGKGWGANGYEIKDTSMDYNTWREKNSKRLNPSFMGAGYASKIIGKHPSGLLIVDDILDEGNTSSDLKMEDVRKILTGTIYPMMMESTLLLFIFTPWRDNDPVVTVTSAENFLHIKTPAYVEDEDGEFFKPLNKKVKLAKSFAIKNIESLENRYTDSGSVEFARMYALDLSKTGNQEFRWYDFPTHLCKWDWYMVGGADYASSLKNWSGAQTDSDYYALAYVAKLPEGGAVVVDGILEKTTLLSALYYAERAQDIYSGWKGTVVETDGKGTEFVQTLYMLKPDLKIIPSGTKGKNKHVRLREMAPWFENGRVRISDANTPFLNELRKEMRLFPNTPHDDAMDAVYWALTAIVDVLQMPKVTGALPGTMMELKKSNPFNSFARR